MIRCELIRLHFERMEKGAKKLNIFIKTKIDLMELSSQLTKTLQFLSLNHKEVDLDVT